MSAPKETESLRAFAVDTADGQAPSPAEPTVSLPPPVRRVPFVAKLVFGVVIGGCVVVLSLSARALHADFAKKHAPPPAVAAAPPPEVHAPPPAVVAAPPPAPVAEAPAPPPVESKPAETKDSSKHVESKPTTATIRRAKSVHSLKVDGKSAKGESVEVSCGSHVVTVDKEKPRHVDAVCGRVLLVDKTKATLLNEKPDHKGKHKPH